MSFPADTTSVATLQRDIDAFKFGLNAQYLSLSKQQIKKIEMQIKRLQALLAKKISEEAKTMATKKKKT